MVIWFIINSLDIYLIFNIVHDAQAWEPVPDATSGRGRADEQLRTADRILLHVGHDVPHGTIRTAGWARAKFMKAASAPQKASRMARDGVFEFPSRPRRWEPTTLRAGSQAPPPRQRGPHRTGSPI